MLKKALLGCALALAATPAFADFSSCYEPIAPVAVDGATADEKQMMHAQSDVKDFIKASDDYQVCLQSQYQKMKKDAANAKDKKPIDPSITDDLNSRIGANQKLKEKVGAEFNSAVGLYKQKHP
ncbi:MAG TPA: hypothetical protein VG889_22230 [Rhizomicrobium sp.]|nr:hypothetical protein [Rhizomicrobium sp.]